MPVTLTPTVSNSSWPHAWNQKHREPPINAKEVHRALKALANPEIAVHSQRFFKTGPGEYGEGDRFLGIRVPELRKQVRHFRGLELRSILAVLKSEWHEERLLALFLLVDRFERGDEAIQREVYEAYLAHTKFINNWDLVDSSAHKIVGRWLQERDRSVLYDLVVSDSLWERRIAIFSTFYWIRQGDFSDTLALSELLLDDPEDLIHKSVGWMLREVGNKDRNVEMAFLDQHAHRMPRTMLSYAIEKFPARLRQEYRKK